MPLLHIPSKNCTTTKCYLFLKGVLYSSLCYNTEWYYDQIWRAAGDTADMYHDVRQKSIFPSVLNWQLSTALLVKCLKIQLQFYQILTN
jgi:hypothetical protein